jgi:hypothetical protein
LRLVSLNEFRRLVYSPESAPCVETLRARIRTKQIAGGCVDGGRYFVDMDEYDTVTRFTLKLAQRREELRHRPELQGLI